MALTPVEIRHVELRRAWLRGYRRSGVDRLLTEIADSFEGVWRERADLADTLESEGYDKWVKGAGPAKADAAPEGAV